ncbi:MULTISPECIES: transcriptional regulator HexR [Gammaproteobacteria]|uniref:transcriptional regulator HexR n=1 Tax=Gammaproteobacteria TaxID=1236 RepID=UPI000DCFD172|nr:MULTISPECIES: transcriptional regulator HexR [Gammaproteobacteria]RTE86284.1 transcriptional regulator HexR [Aliidiomarina sp. B3213]TCZ91635.1 transcriptional regulator HexR [Lysobacter sp. N42]
MLDEIRNQLDQLSKSERKVAQVILADPESSIHHSIAHLAHLADVSEPTVNRFCRTMGAKGYPDFKLQVAKSLAKGTPYVHRHVEQSDSAASFSSKIFESTISSLRLTQQNLDIETLEQTIEHLNRAGKIIFMGLGASASVAHDAHNKFLRFDTPVLFSDDILMQRMLAINAKKGDVLIFVSHTGRTKALIEIAELARQSNAIVVGVTDADSPLAHVCSLVLSTQVPEDTDVYMPMASRIAQLLLIDVLVTGFTLKKGPALQEKLRLIKATLRDSRYDKPDHSNYE